MADGMGMTALPPAPPAAVAPIDMPLSPALQVIGKMKDTLKGRTVGILIHDGSDAAAIKAVRKAAEAAGATVKIVAPKLGGAKLNDGKQLAADGQLAGTPSVVFDAVAVLLSSEAAKLLTRESAALDFVSFAWAHLKAIAFDEGAQLLLKAGNVGRMRASFPPPIPRHSLPQQNPPVGTRAEGAHAGVAALGKARSPG